MRQPRVSAVVERADGGRSCRVLSWCPTEACKHSKLLLLLLLLSLLLLMELLAERGVPKSQVLQP